jgi:glycosyltransferase involved in cell wall biosynthesis
MPTPVCWTIPRSMSDPSMTDLRFRRFVFWLNIPSFHQSAFVRALADRTDMEVWFAHEEDLPAERRQMGWVLPDFGKAHLVDAREPGRRAELLAMTDSQTCHAFGSYFILPQAGHALRCLKPAACAKVWISEAFDFQGGKGWLRTQRARYLAARDGASFRRVFAMGDLGTRFFAKAWIPAAKIREFAYTVEPSESASSPGGVPQSEPADLIFVGQLITRKGVDLLLDALASRRGENWRLQVVGDGTSRSELLAQTRALGLESRVTFTGNLPHEATRTRIRTADCLILPSRWDGWGAVVNEALQCGTYVLVSDVCGASATVVGSTARGRVFRGHDVSALAAALGHYFAARDTRHDSRQQTIAWARQAISAASVAEYFVEALQREGRIAPPWKDAA